MSAPFKYYFSRGALIRGRHSLNISSQTGGANSSEALFRAQALFQVNTVYFEYQHEALLTPG